MIGLCILPIVEGHGEVEAIRPLLQRIGAEACGGYVDVLRPIREHRSSFTKAEVLTKRLLLAAVKLEHHPSPAPKAVLVLADADEDCPRELASFVLEVARSACSHVDVACVVAQREFESWFVAAADSLDKYLTCEAVPETPERHGKGWIEERFRDGRYDPTIDQARMAASMNLGTCCSRSRSFDKLCRELERRLSRSGGANAP